MATNVVEKIMTGGQAINRDSYLAEPVPLPSVPLRENQGHETDHFAAAPLISSSHC